ncbi:DnaD domain-containing protein [Facklamia hominis]|uniref:DnaD domain-containing protein n=1 Tax=Facklamia hominis TaxID=178214 RepID=UPI0038FC7D48
MSESIYDWMKSGCTIIPNILIQRFAQLKLTSDEFVVVVYLLEHIHNHQSVDTVASIANQLGWSSEKLYANLNSLLDKNYLNIELVSNDQGKKTDHYTLRPLFDYLNDQMHKEQTSSQAVGQQKPSLLQNETKMSQLLQQFEEGFGRGLSSSELDMVNQWINQDKYSLDLIQLALREAMIREAYSFKYIDRILLNWQQNNIKTYEEARAYIQAFDQKSIRSASDYQEPSLKDQNNYQIPIIDWGSS